MASFQPLSNVFEAELAIVGALLLHAELSNNEYSGKLPC